MWQATKNHYHFLQALIALLLYGFPGRGLTIIGVTGTDGKTTTASIIYHILRHSGYKAALVSTVNAVLDGEEFDTGLHITTPGRFAVQSYLRKARKLGIKYIVLEVTSHSLDQHRVYGTPFTVGVLTNITREHLDYHKTWERYVHAKAKLLRAAQIAILNKDDKSYGRIKKQELRRNENKVVTYGMRKDADLSPHTFKFQTKLFGQFNQYNCLAAIAACQAIKIPDDKIRKALTSFKPPAGRTEVVYNKDFQFIVDFAHTPNSFAQLLPEVRKQTHNRLIHVFGSAGKRDAYKRPEMGKISSEYADIIIVTAEDPRNEPIEKISEEISAGISKFQVFNDKEALRLEKGKKYLFKIPDRKEAIEFAVSLAQKGDIVLSTGKGHEKSMNYGRGEEPWDEKEVALEAVKKR